MKRSPWQFIAFSNLLSYGSLLASLVGLSLIKVSHNPWACIGMALSASVIFDLFDGKFARLFKRQPDGEAFGVQLDSLVDALVFGFAPVVAFFLLYGFNPLLLAAGFLYALAAVTRLGFYNIISAEEEGFIGLPTTLAGLVLSGFLLFRLSLGWAMACLILLALAMVAPFSIPRPGIKFLLFIAALALGEFLVHAFLLG